MEIDQLKSAAEEDQMEMMLLMDKLPEFYDTYNVNDVPDLSPSEFTGTSHSPTTTTSNLVDNPIPHFIDHPQVSTAPPFMILPSNPSFNNPPFQDQSPHDFLPDPATANTYSTTASQKRNSSMAAMREMIFRIAAMQPIHIDPESVKPPKRRNVKISKDPQSVAARHRRERISERIRILQRLVPGGTKMDTASMLDEAIHYVKFLKTQVQSLERAQANSPTRIGFPVAMSSGSYLPLGNNKAYHHHHHHQLPAQNVENYGDAN